MYCTKCGKKCRDDAKFCSSCGAPVLISRHLTPDMSAQEELPDTLASDVSEMPAGDNSQKGGNHRKLILWIILIVVIAAAVFAVVFYLTGRNPDETSADYLETGNAYMAADESSVFADEAYGIIDSFAKDDGDDALVQEETEQSDDQKEVQEAYVQSTTAKDAYLDAMDQLEHSGIRNLSYAYYDINGDGQDELIIKDKDDPAVVNEDSPTQIYAFDGEKAVPLLDEEDLDSYNEYFIRIYPNGCIQTWCYDSDIYALKEEAYFIGEDGYSLDTISGYWDTVENPDVTHFVEEGSEEVRDGSPAELKGLAKETGDRQTGGTEFIDIDWSELVIDESGTVHEAVISEKNAGELVSPLNKYITYILVAYYYPNAYDSSEALNYAAISPAQVYALAGLALRDGYLLKSDPLADPRAVLPTELYQQYIDNMFGSEYSLDQFVPYSSPWGTVVEKNSSGEFVVALSNEYGAFSTVSKVEYISDTANEKGVYTATVEYGVSYEGGSDVDNFYMDFYLRPDDNSDYGCVIVGMNPAGFD